MAINFDSLPDVNPNGVVPDGIYKAKISTADMKQGSDATKPPYLNLCYSLTNKDGQNVGKMFDLITESAHQLMQYKLKRFIEALKIPIRGSFELKDLCKVVVNKEFLITVKTEEQEGKPPKNVVDIFAGEIYYPMEMMPVLWDVVPTPMTAEGELPEINAPDAVDGELFANSPAPTDDGNVDY